jgi:hypothetical protein
MVQVTSTIRRRWREDDGSLSVVVKVPLPVEDVVALVEEIVDAVRFRLDADETDPMQVEPQRLSKGAAISVTDCLDVNILIGWITEELVARGHDDAKLTALGWVRPLHGHGITTWPEDEVGIARGYLSLRGHNGPSENVLQSWITSEDDTRAATRYLLDWALALPGAETTADISLGSVTARTHTSGLGPVLDAAARRTHDTQLPHCEVIIYAGQRFRSLNICRDRGVAVFTEGHELASEFDWTTAVQSTTEALRGAGEWCTYGHVTRAVTTFGLSWGTGASHGTLGEGVFPEHEMRGRMVKLHERNVIEQGHLYDAFGIMRLPAELAATLTLERAWSVEAIPSQPFVLASHRDLAAWFAAPVIDPATIREARERLAPRVLDHSAETSNSWEHRQRIHEWHRSINFNGEIYWAHPNDRKRPRPTL